jgi:hypothetical protein
MNSQNKSLPRVLTAIAALFVFAAGVRADGLVGYRNDSTQPVIVQSAVVVNNTVRRSKPQLLYPGEVAVDGLSATGVRRVSLYDPKKPTVVLHQEDFNNAKDSFLSIQIDTTVMVGVKPTAPKFKLVSVALPTMPGPGKPPSLPPAKKK